MALEDTDMLPDFEVTDKAIAEIRAGFRIHAHMSLVRQEKINAASRRIENSSRLMDGIGQLKYRIDSDLYWHMRAIHGPDCWKDPGFLKACERDGVIQRVKGISEKITSIMGLSPDKKRSTLVTGAAALPSFPTAHLPLISA